MAAPLVFITGASSGIGQALALRYHRASARVAYRSRSTSSALSVPQKLSIGALSQQSPARLMLHVIPCPTSSRW